MYRWYCWHVCHLDGVSIQLFYVQVDPLYAGLFSGSFLLLAIAAVVKDTIFQDARAKLGGKDLDIFVVNSFGSASQALFVFLLLPLLSHLKGIPFSQLPSYLSQGAGHVTARTYSTHSILYPLRR